MFLILHDLYVRYVGYNVAQKCMDIHTSIPIQHFCAFVCKHGFTNGDLQLLAFTLGMSVICKILIESRPCYAQYAQLYTHTVCETVRPRIHTAFSKQQPNKKFVTGKCVLKVILISGMYTCMYIGASLPSMYENDEFHLSYVSYHIHAFRFIRVKDILHGNRLTLDETAFLGRLLFPCQSPCQSNVPCKFHEPLYVCTASSVIAVTSSKVHRAYLN